jgi:hypothetical protein
MSMSRIAVLGSAGLVLGWWASAAQAQTCATNTDCPHGFACEVTGGTACAVPACAPNTPCPPTPPCETQVFRECRPGSCSVDADCALGMVCHTEQIETCSGAAVPPCAAGSACPKIAPPSCTVQTSQSCVPRYILPCTQDTDCGAGFSCNEQQTCSCSGSSGGAGSATPAQGISAPAAPPGDAGQAPPAADLIPTKIALDAGTPAPTDPDASQPTTSCECHASGQKMCELQVVPCQRDADCPTQFSCQAVATTNVAVVGCAVPAAGAGGSSSTCDVPIAAPQVERKQCVPPYASAYGGAVPRAASASAMSVGSSGGSTQSDAAVATGAPSATPTHSGDPTGTGSAPEAEMQQVKACSVSAPGARLTLPGLLGLVGLLAGVIAYRRRRTARAVARSGSLTGGSSG